MERADELEKFVESCAINGYKTMTTKADLPDEILFPMTSGVGFTEEIGSYDPNDQNLIFRPVHVSLCKLGLCCILNQIRRYVRDGRLDVYDTESCGSQCR